MTRSLAIITCLVLAACGGAGESDETTTSATSTSAPASTTTAGSTPSPDATSGTTDETTALGESPDECTSPTGYSVSYPASWWANDGSVVDACGLFGPEPVDLEPATDVNAPINIYIDPVPFDVAAAPTETGEEIDRAVTLIDGARAVRSVTRVGEGLLPEGTEVTSYVVDVATDETDRTMIMTTADVEAYDYVRNARVLDAMAQSLELDVDTKSNLVAQYRGGGAPFDVTATAAAGTVCLTASPPDEEVCLSLPNGEAIVVDTIGDIAIGLAAPDVFQVEATDGISYLPVALAGTDARGWALPIDGPTQIVATDRSGEQLASLEVGV